MSGTVMRFEDSELPEGQKAALRLAAAFLSAPGGLTVEARAAALEHYSPGEIAAMLLKLTALTFNKPRVALGFDRVVDPDRLTFFEYLEEGGATFVQAPAGASAP